MGRGVIVKNNGKSIYINGLGGKMFDEKRPLYQGVTIVPGENIRMGDYLICEYHPDLDSRQIGHHTIRKTTGGDQPNCYAGEDLTNIDGTAFVILSKGAVYNKV